jgi:glyoxylase-like metal-dependent hydrolase (beta-lactamase superfamily II)
VLITHAHSDHTGVAERARTTATAPVWIHHADAAVAKGSSPPRTTARPGRICCEWSSTGPWSHWRVVGRPS